MTFIQPYDEAKCEAIAKLILGTINAPRPHHITTGILWEVVKSGNVPRKWLPHITALFEEVNVPSHHDAVLCDLVNFAELNQCFLSLKISNTEQSDWIDEMSNLESLQNMNN